MVNVFNYPTTILYGTGATAALGERIAAKDKGSRLLLVTDKGVVAAGLAGRVAETLKKAGIATVVFDAVHPNPLEEDVEAGAEVYRAGKFTGLLAVGGGSPMDVAKAIAVLATHPAPLAQYDDTKNGADKIVSPLPPIYAIPTTAGTGSEVGRSAVVTIRSTKRKTIIFHPTLLPRIAVLEPELTTGLPARITAATGMDAFTHGLEAYFARGFHPIADSIALGCVEMVIENLPRAVEKGGDLEARGKMLLAASMGATAFQKGLGVVHSLAHPLSTRYGMHHGLTNALLLPPALDYQAKERGKELGPELRARWQRAARLFPAQEKAGPEDLPASIAAFNRRVGLVETLAGLGLRREDIPALSHEAFEDPCHQLNPLPMTEKDLARIMSDASENNLRIARILKSVRGEAAAGAVVTPLSTGMTNCNFKVEVEGETLVLRLGGENTQLLGIDRIREHATSFIVAELDVGPEVVAFLPEEGALLTRFISGECLTPETARKPEILELIIASILRYHHGPAFPATFSPFETVRRYHALARDHGVSFPPSLGGAMEAMDRIEKALGPLRRTLPCHNDLLPANFIDQGDAVRIVDWEYAGMGDPYFDLGNLAANLGLNVEECELILRRYSGGVSGKDLARLWLQRMASDLRESLWGFLQLGISRIEFDYRSYAGEHLGRFLAGAVAGEFPRWLDQAAPR